MADVFNVNQFGVDTVKLTTAQKTLATYIDTLNREIFALRDDVKKMEKYWIGKASEKNIQELNNIIESWCNAKAYLDVRAGRLESITSMYRFTEYNSLSMASNLPEDIFDK